MTLTRRIILVLLAFALLFTAGCSKEEEEPPQEEDLAQQEEAKEPEEEKESPLFGISDQLYAIAFRSLALSESSGAQSSRALCPLNITEAAALVAAAGSDQTKKQALAVLGCGLDRARNAFSAFKPSGGFAYSESVWLNDEFSFTASFKESVEKDFNASAEAVPFDANTADTVNRLVSEKTGGAVKKAVSSLPDGAQCCLVGAAAFSSEKNPLGKTVEAAFLKDDGSSVSTAMMTGKADAAFSGDGFKGFIAPLSGSHVLIGVRPDGNVSDFLASTDGRDVAEAVRNTLPAETVSASMPPISETQNANLVPLLSDLGMPDAFSASASLPEIAEEGSPIRLGPAVCKTIVKIGGGEDGEGEEPESPDIEVRLDKSFIYIVADRATRSPLIIGAVGEPGEAAR